MLPRPAYRTTPATESSSATASAAPRVWPRALCSSSTTAAGELHGAVRKACRAAWVAAAASGPWPSPSQTSAWCRLSRTRSANPSPHTFSPVSGRVRPAPHAVAGTPVGQICAAATVPRPGTEWASYQLACREMEPSPMPRVPAVEWPSRPELSRSVMPGPESIATSSTPAVSSRRTGRTNRTPSSACLARLLVSSATTMDSFAVWSEPSSSRAASRSAVRRTALAVLPGSTRNRAAAASPWTVSRSAQVRSRACSARSRCSPC